MLRKRGFCNVKSVRGEDVESPTNRFESDDGVRLVGKGKERENVRCGRV